MENTIITTNFTETEALVIHKELHEKHCGEFITLNNKHFAVYKYGNVKVVNVNGDRFAQQTKTERGKLADMANRGERITHIVPSDGGELGLIIGDKVIKLI